jgi:hypothetical protein
MSAPHGPDGPVAVLGRRIIPHTCYGTQALRTEAMLWRVRQGSGMVGGHDMATVIARKAETPVGRTRPGAENLSRDPLTLTDVITAVQDVVGPEDDRLVVATVRNLLRSGRWTRCGAGYRSLLAVHILRSCNTVLRRIPIRRPHRKASCSQTCVAVAIPE